jgi:hypothetical protein
MALKTIIAFVLLSQLLLVDSIFTDDYLLNMPIEQDDNDRLMCKNEFTGEQLDW